MSTELGQLQFWVVLIVWLWALYLLILLDAGRVTRRWRLWVASTDLITGLTLVAGTLLPILDVLILFYNALPLRFRPPVPPLS